MKKYIFAFSLFFIYCGAGYAQQADIVTQKIPQKAQFAQPFEVRFELSHTPGYVLELDKDTLPKDFTLTQEQKEILSPGTEAYDLTFLPFTLGVSTFTAVTFNLRESNGGPVIAQAVSDKVSVEVAPVHYFNDKNIRDIRPPYIPSNPLIWLLIILVIGLIIFFSRRFIKDIKNHQSQTARKAPIDNRPPEVIALSKIEILLQSGLWEQKQYKLFYTELEDILRDYFWRRLHLDVSSDTSLELLNRARRTPQLAPLLALLRQYLASTDLVKFAKIAPSQEVMQRDVSSVRQIIQDTTPKPESMPEEKR